jgi:hypothetical protein
MSEAKPSTATPGAPWHLWVVGILGILWNAYGCYDFYMSNTQGEAYFREAGMSDAAIAYFNAMPAWMYVVWAVGVFGAVIGAILLLLRSKWAVPVFAASLIAYVLSLLYTYLLSNGGEVVGEGMWIMQLVILAACLFFLWYAWWAQKRGMLR